MSESADSVSSREGIAPHIPSVGRRLFPLLYLYYLGDRTRQGKVGNRARFDEALRTVLAGEPSGSGSPSGDLVAYYQRHALRLGAMLSDVLAKNDRFKWMLTNTASTIMQTYGARLPVDPRRVYYSSGSRRVVSTTPLLDEGDARNVENVMESFRLLFENGILPADFELGLREVSLFDGSFIEDEYTTRNALQNRRVLGLPQQGIFTTNKNGAFDYMYKTFSGIDIKAVASLGSVVSDLDGITNLSWSVHSPKGTVRPLSRTSPGGTRSMGARTIAGTIIFAMANHEPLLKLLPSDMAASKQGPHDKRVYRPHVSVDQLPPFDLMAIMTNEYGFASILSIYGMQIVDHGGSLGIDSLVTEGVYQYTALSMDPIIEVGMDESGLIDPFGLTMGGYSEFWYERERVIAGVHYSELESQFDSYFTGLLSRNI